MVLAIAPKARFTWTGRGPLTLIDSKGEGRVLRIKVS